MLPLPVYLTSMLSSLMRRPSLFGRKSYLQASRLLSDEKNKTIEVITLAPLVYNYAFQRVFSDKLNMRYLLNSAIDTCRMSKTSKIVTIHHIEISTIPTTTLQEPCESTALFDCCCTYADGTMGILKLITTHDTCDIERDVRDCAKLDYWRQWKEHNAFRYPVRMLVLDFNRTVSYDTQLYPFRTRVDIDIRHACPGLHYHPPTHR